MNKKAENIGKYHIAIVGSRDEILCFKALGVEIFPVKNFQDALSQLFLLKKMPQNEEQNSSLKYAVIFVMEDVIKKINSDDLKKLTAGALPAVIALPGNKGASGFGENKLRQLVEKAVGSDIFGN